MEVPGNFLAAMGPDSFYDGGLLRSLDRFHSQICSPLMPRLSEWVVRSSPGWSKADGDGQALAALGSGGQKDRSRPGGEVMARARVAGPGFDAQEAGDTGLAPQQEIGRPHQIHLEVPAGVPFLQPDPG